MLTNGITLKLNSELLKGLQEVPELGVEPEKVEVTTLDSKNKVYEFGIGDAPDLAYTFLFDNSEDGSYRKLRELETSQEVGEFEHTYPDGTSFTFSGYVSTKISGGGINSALTFTLNIAITTDLTIKNPL